MKDFAHLHLHTSYSMLDGAIRIKELMKHVKDLGMSSVAMTDHGNMFGAIEFYNEAKKQGIKPIIGSEFYISPNRKAETEEVKIADGNAYHLILLAKNQIGYQNLIKLSSKSYTEGFYKKARIDYDLLEKNSDGLICLTACLAGEVNRKILEEKDKESFQLAGKLNEIFRKEDFYLEIQKHGIKEQEIVASKAYEFSKKSGIPLILTNDSHFLKKEDKEAQDILLRIGMQKRIDDPMDFGFNSEFYVKSPEEMFKLFPELPDAFHRTLEVRDKCNLELKYDNFLLPNFEVPDNYTPDSFLEELVHKGIQKKYKTITKEIKDRTKFELDTITNMNFSGYFLIVQDYINYAKQINIPVGPGRGSAAGSIVAYALGITNVDPLEHHLLFERFLNPERKDMPDIDTDFCVDRREEVIQYIKTKYGEDKVGQIITFNTLAAKAAVKDVARVLNVNFTEANELTKAFPHKLGITISEALDISKELKNASLKNETNKKVFDIATRLEGNYRQPGRHAAGVVISPVPLEEIVPLSTVAEKDKKGRSIVTQFEKNNLESIGLIKMDILGLKNLTTIDYALKLIKKTRGHDVNINEIPFDDANTFSLLRKANTLGIFQLESRGITDLVAKSQVNNFDEIVALIALYRPGPMDSGMLETYLNRKTGKEKVVYPPSCQEILQETFGVAVYQEQVMSISRIVGGFSVGESDTLRKAMAKKKNDLIEDLKIKFVEGALIKGLTKKSAEELYDILAKFGGYGFNKSHSVAYAMITYQTAFLKANYPTEYMTALLASDQNDTSNIVKYINNAIDMGIKILNPDINESDLSFTIISENEIRFGLSAIKGVGSIASTNIIESRKQNKKFDTLTKFLMNIDNRVVNKKVIEALILSGALDSFKYSRKSLFEYVDSMISFAGREQSRKLEGQFSLFAGTSETINFNLPEDSKEWSSDEKLKKEKEVTGIYLSGHPLDKFEAKLKFLNSLSIEALDQVKSGTQVEIFGIVNSLNIRYNKKNQEFASFKIEDKTGDIDCIIFPSAFVKFKNYLKEDNAIIIKGELDKVEIGESELRGQIKVNLVEELNQKSIEEKLEKSLHLKINDENQAISMIPKLYSLFSSYKGDSNIYFHIIRNGEEKTVIKAHERYAIQPAKELLTRLSTLLGENSVYFSIGEEVRAF